MARTSTNLSVNSVNNDINGDVNGVQWYFTISVHLNYNRSHINIIDDKATKLDARTN